MREEHDEERRRHIEEWRARSETMLDADSVDELRGLSEQELVWRHDATIEQANYIKMMGAKTPFLDYARTYMNELMRRESIRQGERMEKLTRSLNLLTWVITIATLIGVVLTAWAVLHGG